MRIPTCAVGMAASIKRDACEPMRGGGRNRQYWKNSAVAEFGQYCLFSLFFFFFVYIPVSPPPCSGVGPGRRAIPASLFKEIVDKLVANSVLFARKALDSPYGILPLVAVVMKNLADRFRTA